MLPPGTDDDKLRGPRVDMDIPPPTDKLSINSSRPRLEPTLVPSNLRPAELSVRNVSSLNRVSICA